jgi:hypothetical protein
MSNRVQLMLDLPFKNTGVFHGQPFTSALIGLQQVGIV